MRNYFWTLAALCFVALSACKPDYPKCDSDDNCKEKGEVCVNKQCQECRDSEQCVAKHGPTHECFNGRCEVKPECRADGDCASVGQGLVCRSNKCVPECGSNEDCPSGHKCESQKCVGECNADVDCGLGRTCSGGVCQDNDRNAGKVSGSCKPMNASSGDVIHAETIRFEFDQYELTVDARQSLDNTAKCIQEAGDLRIVLEGHADDRGTQEYNLALGEKRANTVKAYLKNLGVNASRVETRSKGENEPICRDDSDSCWSQNRRVEFIQKRGR